MLPDTTTLVAVPAYLGFTACLAVLSSRLPAPAAAPRPPFRGTGFARLAGVPALAVFFLLPPGTLPPFIPVDTGMLLALALFGLTLLLLGLASPGAKKDIARAVFCGLLPLLAAGLVTAWVAFTRGFPGAMFDMGTPVTTPLWSVMGGTGRAGVVCMAAALLLFAANALPQTANKAPLAWCALRLGAAQFIIALLLPLSPSRLLPFDLPAAGPALDFLWNWLFVFGLAHGLMPFTARHAKSFAPAWALLLAGGVLCVADTLWG